MRSYFKNNWGTWLLMVLMCLPMFSREVHAETELFGVCVGVTDGDTATILDSNKVQHTVRLYAIDTPETSCHAKTPSDKDASCVERAQPFGKAAKKSLASLIYGKNVRVVLAPGSSYGRKIGTIWVGDVNANLEQVKRGYAWVYRHYTKGMPLSDVQALLDAESMAQEQRSGLWADREPLSPWDWRHKS